MLTTITYWGKRNSGLLRDEGDWGRGAIVNIASSSSIDLECDAIPSNSH